MEAAAGLRPVRVLIADDHQLFAEALQAILAADILMDISMPVMDGFEAIVELAAR